MDQGEGAKTIPVFGLFPDGTELVDAYSGATATVTEGSVTLTTGSDLVLLSRPSPSAGSSRTLSSPSAGIDSPSLGYTCRYVPFPFTASSWARSETLKATTAR